MSTGTLHPNGTKILTGPSLSPRKKNSRMLQQQLANLIQNFTRNKPKEKQNARGHSVWHSLGHTTGCSAVSQKNTTEAGGWAILSSKGGMSEVTVINTKPACVLHPLLDTQSFSHYSYVLAQQRQTDHDVHSLQGQFLTDFGPRKEEVKRRQGSFGNLETRLFLKTLVSIRHAAHICIPTHWRRS